MQFVALHKDKQATDVEWPAMKAMHLYWYDAAKYIKQTACTQHLRDGKYLFFTNFIFIWNVHVMVVSYPTYFQR